MRLLVGVMPYEFSSPDLTEIDPPEPMTPPTLADLRPWVVAKFGGTSVASPERWRSIATIVQDHLRAGRRVVMVCSAIGATSDQIEAAIQAAVAGESPEAALATLSASHVALGEALGVDALSLIGREFDDLRRLLEGVQTIGEAPPRLRARLFSAGELMATRIGAAYLVQRGFDASWEDARGLLRASSRQRRLSPEAHYLSATCSFAADPALARELAATGADLIVTQGFIARDDEGSTVLLGRGGSDTSAAYFAARLGASRLEIWTDVPGMFTTNPRLDPQARLLPRLSYDEAEALANLGARVLHPRCIGPARARGIPLWVRCTDRPQLPGSVIEAEADDEARDAYRGPRALAIRDGLVLLSMRRDPSWQPVGFLADVTACFKRHGLSIDLLSTSPAEIKVTIERAAAPSLDRILPALVADLEAVAAVEVVAEVASVSLVGRGIRQALADLSGALGSLGGRELQMIVQGSDDLHLTMVVDAGEAHELAKELHAVLIADATGDANPTDAEARPLGEAWVTLMAATSENASTPGPEATQPPSTDAAGDRHRAIGAP